MRRWRPEGQPEEHGRDKGRERWSVWKSNFTQCIRQRWWWWRTVPRLIIHIPWAWPGNSCYFLRNLQFTMYLIGVWENFFFTIVSESFEDWFSLSMEQVPYTQQLSVYDDQIILSTFGNTTDCTAKKKKMLTVLYLCKPQMRTVCAFQMERVISTFKQFSSI